MLLSISKIWNNHQDNVWLDSEQNYQHSQNYLDSLTRDHDRLLHPKDLSSFLFHYEVSRRHQQRKIKKKNNETMEEGSE